MHMHVMTIQRNAAAASNWFSVAAEEQAAARQPIYQEREWRQLAVAGARLEEPDRILASRWTDERTTPRHERSAGPCGLYVIAVALRPVRVRLGTGNDTIFDGTMPAGMVHVTEPGQTIDAEFFSACDTIHFHMAADYVRDRQASSGLLGNAEAPAGERSLRNLLVRDELAAQLSRTLIDPLDGGDPLYAASVGQIILMRLLASRPRAPRVGALPKWRLRRVQGHILANIAEPITLADLAEAAGLSRMHFAAQFRVATGCRPHDYVLQHRIECAKQMLASTDTKLVEVALSLGFQTQSHFSTVFKRLTGNTPARWQGVQRAARDQGGNGT